MKPKIPREHYIPKGATLFHAGADTDSTVYFYSTPAGAPCALVFDGNARKPSQNAQFRNEPARVRYIGEHLASRRLTVATIRKDKAERAQPHTLTAGAVLVSSWGYDQTNVDFYQVLRVISPRTVEIQKIAREVKATSDMTGIATPIKDAFGLAAPIIKRADGTNAVKLNGYSSAHIWDGKPASWSSYA